MEISILLAQQIAQLFLMIFINVINLKAEDIYSEMD